MTGCVQRRLWIAIGSGEALPVFIVETALQLVAGTKESRPGEALLLKPTDLAGERFVASGDQRIRSRPLREFLDRERPKRWMTGLLAELSNAPGTV